MIDRVGELVAAAEKRPDDIGLPTFGDVDMAWDAVIAVGADWVSLGLVPG